jgi:aryl-alcohol dehydrogenase-like predicted oxidoreductase
MLLCGPAPVLAARKDGRSGRHGASANGICETRSHRPRSVADQSRLHELRGGGQRQPAWSLGEEDARPFIKRALEGGINFFDTANRYSLGSSEEILGRAIRDFAHRDEVVIATKVYGRMRPGSNGGGLSRKAIMSEIDASLRRLGMDYVDLYQIHRWDHETPIEETLEALHDVVKAGKARYIGASSMYAWQFGKALAVAERNGWTRFVSMQNLVNLLYREEEREMLPLCAAEGIGVIPWSPQARGRLTRDWDYTSLRTETDEAITRLFAKTEAADKKVASRPWRQRAAFPGRRWRSPGCSQSR